MNKQVYQNKAILMNALNRDKLYKKGKQWIVASSLFLGLLAGGSLLGNAVHADSIQPQAKTTLQNKNQQTQSQIKQQPQMNNKNLQSQTKVATQATNLHNQLLNNSNNTYNKGLSKLANLQNNSHRQLTTTFNNQRVDHPEVKTGESKVSTPTNNTVMNGVAFVDANNSNSVINKPFYVTGNKGNKFTFNKPSQNNSNYANYSQLIPNGYKLNYSDGNANKNNFTFNSDNQNNDLVSLQPTTTNSINLEENPVDVSGTVYLHIRGHAVIPLPYDFQTTTNATNVNVLNHTTPSVSTPSDYLNTGKLDTLESDMNLSTNSDTALNNEFSTQHYQYNGSMGSDTNTSKDWLLNIKPSDNTSFQDGTRLMHKDYNFYYEPAKSEEAVHYIYHGQPVGFDEEWGTNGTTHIAGSNVDNHQPAGVYPGYYIPSNSTFTFDNGGSVNVPVVPKHAYADIEFVVDHNGNQQPLTYVKNYYGNYFPENTTKSDAQNTYNTYMLARHINKNDIPAGYNISSADLDKKIPFDNVANTGATPKVSAVIHLIPSVEADHIIYENDQGQIIGSNYDPTGNTFSGASQLNITNASAASEDFPRGYVLSNGENPVFNYDGDTHVVQLSGSAVKDKFNINIVADNNLLRSDTQKKTLTSVGDSFDINPANYAPASNYLPTSSDNMTKVYVNSDGHLASIGNSLGATDNTITLRFNSIKGINGKNGTNGTNGKNGKNGNYELPNTITVNYVNQLGQIIKTGYVTNANGETNNLFSDVSVPSDYDIDTTQAITDYDQRKNITSNISMKNNTLNFTADKDPHTITIHVSGLTGSQIAHNEITSASNSASSAVESAEIIINGLNSAASAAKKSLSSEAKNDGNNSGKESADPNYQKLANELKSLEDRQGYNTSVASSAKSTSTSASETVHGLSSAESAAKSLASSASNAASGKDKSNSSASSADKSMESSADSVVTKDSKYIIYLDSIISSAESESSSDKSGMSSASSNVTSASKAVSSAASQAQADKNNSSAESNDQKSLSSANAALSSADAVSGSVSADDSSANSIISSADNLINGASNTASTLESEIASLAAAAKSKGVSPASSSADQKQISSDNSELSAANSDISAANAATSRANSAYSSAENALNGLNWAKSSASTATSSASAAMSNANKDHNSSAYNSAQSAYNSASSADSSASSADTSESNVLNNDTLASASAFAKSEAALLSSVNAALSAARSAEQRDKGNTSAEAADASSAKNDENQSTADHSAINSADSLINSEASSASSTETSVSNSTESALNSLASALSAAEKAAQDAAKNHNSSAASKADSEINSANSAKSSAESASKSATNESNAASNASQFDSGLAFNDSSADSASNSAKSASSEASYSYSSAIVASKSANAASTSASSAYGSASSTYNSASSVVTHSKDSTAVNSAKSAEISASNAEKSAQSAENSANSASTSASNAVNIESSASTSASSASVTTSNVASLANSAAASAKLQYDPDTYITIIEQENGKPVNSFAKLINESNVQTGGTFTIRPSDSSIQPAGFTPDNSNQDIIGTMTTNGIKLLPGTDTFVYDADNVQVNEATQSGKNKNIIPIINQSNDNIPASTQTIHGAKNQALSNNQIPAGYKLDPARDYHFDNQGNLVGIEFKNGKPETNPDGSPIFEKVTALHVIGDRVNGKANIILNYEILPDQSGTDKIIHKADDAQIIINGRVGDHIHFDPWKYVKTNYNVPASDFNGEHADLIIPSDAVSPQYNYGQDYATTKEFNYNARKAAPIKVIYRNTDNNGQQIGTPDEFTINGIAGETVYLGDKNTDYNNNNGHYNVLNIPKGYYLPGGYVKAVLTPEVAEDSKHGNIRVPLTLTVNLHLGSVNDHQATDSIIFDGDPLANTVVFGTLGENGSVDAPTGYHFVNGDNGSFTYNDQTHTFHVETNDPTNTNNNIVNYNLPNGSSMKSFINSINGTNGNNKSTNPAMPTGNGQNIVNDIHTPKANNNEAITKIAKHLKQGQSIVVNTKNGKLTINSKRTGSHYRWLYVIKPILLHRNIEAVGSNHDALRRIKPRHRFYARIINIYKLVGNGRNFTRYEISVKIGHYYRHVFVTGNPKFVRNAYYQVANLHHAKKYHHRYYKARIITPTFVYKGRFYTRRNRQHLMRVGKIVHISRIVRIGRKGDKQTKFELTNGHYITANKNFIKLI